MHTSASFLGLLSSTLHSLASCLQDFWICPLVMSPSQTKCPPSHPSLLGQSLCLPRCCLGSLTCGDGVGQLLLSALSTAGHPLENHCLGDPWTWVPIHSCSPFLHQPQLKCPSAAACCDTPIVLIFDCPDQVPVIFSPR